MGTPRRQPPNEPAAPPAADRLDSWKEIAAYLRRDVRTVQRWEERNGLPVYRHTPEPLKGSPVYAYRSELDAWFRHPAVHEAGGRALSADVAAVDDYLKGRHALQTMTPDGLTRAREHFERAVARDPAFALAYDALAETHWHLGYFGFEPPREAFSKGVLIAVRALELDGSLAQTHALLGQYHKQLDYNWPEVEREMARALELDPASHIVRSRYALNFLMPQGRLEEAVAELERALELDPLPSGTQTMLAIVLLLWRQYDRAIAQAELLLELEPFAYWGHCVIASCHRDQGRLDAALPHMTEAVELSNRASAMLGWLGLLRARRGETGEARALLQELGSRSTSSYVPPTSFAWIHLGLGEIDCAFTWLDRAVEDRDQLMMPIKSYGFFDPIRPDPRFRRLLRKMRLDDERPRP